MSYQDIVISGDWFSVNEMLKKKETDSAQEAKLRSKMVK
jgi:hypothetical protein